MDRKQKLMQPARILSHIVTYIQQMLHGSGVNLGVGRRAEQNYDALPRFGIETMMDATLPHNPIVFTPLKFRVTD